MNNKAEIGATLTWIVATIIILVIIFIFMVVSGVVKITPGTFIGKGEISALKFPEQQQTLYAISKDTEIRNLIIAEEYDEAEVRIKPILEKIRTTPGKPISGWNLEIYKNGEKIKKITTNEITYGLPNAYDKQNFYIIFYNVQDKYKLRLYLECQDVSCGDT